MMRLTKRLAALLTAAMITVTAFTATPAQAATGYARCPWYKSCYFSQYDGQGSMWEAPGPGWWTVPFDTYSVYNRGSGKVYIHYWDYEPTGYSFLVNTKGNVTVWDLANIAYVN